MGCVQQKNKYQEQSILDMPHIFFIIGGPGSGKGTQCTNLVQDYKFKHLSTGDLLRQQKQKGGKDAQQLNKIMNEGKLVPSELVVKLIKKALIKYGNRRYLLDGFPRNQQNMKIFKQTLKHTVVIRGMIFFDCSKTIMMQRIINRAKTSGRADDNQQTILKRLDTYQKETFPIIQDFKRENVCIDVNANTSPQEVYIDLKSKLEELDVFPPSLVQTYSLIGGPGSGKGTQSLSLIYLSRQCAKLVQKYGFKHISTGDLIRNQVKKGSQMGTQLQKLMNQGKMVSSQLVVNLMKDQFQRNNFTGRYLIDGFPRNQLNIQVWNSIMKKTADINAVLYFHCGHQQLKKRLLERGKTSGRSDDNQATIQKRLNTFENQTKPLVDYYSENKKLKQFDASKTVDQVFQDLEQYFETKNVQPKEIRKNVKIIIVLGGPGSGKGTQCQKLIQNFGFKHISTGDLIRNQLKKNSLFAQEINQKVNSGQMVSSSLIVKLIRKAIARQAYDGIFLLDGFPRNEQNIQKWKQQFGIQIRFNNLINFQCSSQQLQKRLIHRGLSSGRSDDNPQTIKKRIQTFKKESQPLLKSLAQTVDFSITVNSQKPVDQVSKELQRKLKNAGYRKIK